MTDYEWAEQMGCAVTVCDTEGNIVYMNEQSRLVNARGESLVGRNLMPCHNPQSQAKIHELLANGGTHAYTIEKHGQKKMIYQTAWKRNGVVAGLVEISMPIPGEMPHYIRS